MRLSHIFRTLLGRGQGRGKRNVFLKQSESFQKAYSLVTFFYVCQLFYLNQAFGRWLPWRQAERLDLLWPVAWIDWLGIVPSVDFIIIFFSTGTVLAAMLPHLRWCRLAACAGLFFYISLFSSFGKIGHGWHAWFFVSLLLIFLPGGEKNRVEQSRLKRQKYLSVILAVQGIILLFYSLSGFWKLSSGLSQAVEGGLSSFSIDGFAYVVADRLLSTGSETLAGPLIVSYPWVGWILFWSAVYFELFSIFVLFRPSLHRLWGLGLIGVHLGSVLIMSIVFSRNVLLIGLFFICSPFYTKSLTPKQLILSLPGFSLVSRILRVRASG